jgi:hypothetical protein
MKRVLRERDGGHIVSETFGRVAHPPLRITMETSRKKKKKDLALFMVYLIKKEFSSPTPRRARSRTRSKQEPADS